MRFILASLVVAIALVQLTAANGYGYEPNGYKDRDYNRYPQQKYKENGKDYDAKKKYYDYLEKIWIQNVNRNKNNNQDDTISENESYNNNWNMNDLLLLKKFIEKELYDKQYSKPQSYGY
ncbi:hypothetical protein BpHYR1_009785 [Brachionus plicatilis]|uniref:Uncharacterized protein n=1 Tax=Brachionus plicatilis TaxID=10195 RepID=A0A3M7P261_BRAPC|nr:hypothetical protein BpHYR1_009785 [Brachionus plicatilis]